MKSQWTQAGLEALRKGGVAGVRVERLAEDIGLTKGSFYWHFRGRGELLEALLEFWAREMTEAEFERVQAVRAWARADRKVAAAVAQVDRRRVRALTGFFEEGGFTPAEARTRARLFYTFLLGEPQVRAPAREPGELKRMVDILAAA